MVGHGSVTCGGTWECYLWWDMGVLPVVGHGSVTCVIFNKPASFGK